MLGNWIFDRHPNVGGVMSLIDKLQEKLESLPEDGENNSVVISVDHYRMLLNVAIAAAEEEATPAQLN